MGTLTEQRAAALKAAQDIIDRATKASRDLTDDEVTEVERHQDQVRDLDKKLKAQGIVKSVLTLTNAEGEPASDGVKVLSPSAWAAKAARRMRGINDDDDSVVLPGKSVQSGSWTLPATLVDFVRNADRATTLLELIPRKPATRNYGYIQQTVRTNNAAMVADAATKPTSIFTLREVLDHLRVLAHLSEPVPIRFDTDHADHVELIRTEMVNGLMPKLEDQIIGGSGTGENLTGILNVSGIRTQAYATDIPTTLRKARTGFQNVDEVPNAWVFSPADAEAVDLLREGTGTGQFLELARVLGDIPFVVCRGLPAGNALLGDFRQSRLYVGEDMRFDVDTGGALFDTNTYKMRAEGRFGFAVLRPIAFCLVDLTA